MVQQQKKHEVLQSETQQTIEELRRRHRAVTVEDYEQLVLEDWNKSRINREKEIARVKCLPQRDLENKDIKTFAAGHISLVVVPKDQRYIVVPTAEELTENSEERINKSKDIYQKIKDFFEPRKLLTTRLHIIEPTMVEVGIETKLVLKDGAQPEEVKKNAKAEVQMFFLPLNSGKYWQGNGYPFGRSVYLSELYKLLDDLVGVDYVESLQIKDLKKTQNNETLSEIHLTDNQLVKFQHENSKFTIIAKVGNEHKEI